jgi:Zn-dependent protease with chaperone function
MKNYELRTSIVDVAVRAGIRNANVLVWDTHQRIMNALAIGVIFRPKTIVLTDKLISCLSLQELLAVTAHEFGHHKYRHIPFLIITLVCILVWSFKAFTLFGFDVSSELIYIFQLILCVGGIICMSRQFEEQADAYASDNLSSRHGSEVVTQDAANAMANALGAIASAQQINKDRYDLLHGSIRSRQQKLQHLVGCKLSEVPINKKVKRIKIVLLCIMVVGFII